MVPGPIIGGWLSSQYGIPAIIDGKPATIPTPIIFMASSLIILLTIIPIIFAKELKNKSSN